MTEVLLAALAFYLLQLMLPSLMAVVRGEVTTAALFAQRDQPVEKSIPVGRADRAAKNIQESMLVFVPLLAMGIVTDTNLAGLATVWLGLRIAYLITYVLGIAYIRTFIWFGSIYCLGAMAVALV
jgi:uncharacterized MAPEG superfamily protein